MKKKITNKEDEEKLRISRYFRKLLKLIANELLNNNLVTKIDLYNLCENSLIEENISSNPIYIKYKYTDRFLPKVTVRLEFTSLNLPIKIGYKGSFTIVRPMHKFNQENVFINKYSVKECKLN